MSLLFFFLQIRKRTWLTPPIPGYQLLGMNITQTNVTPYSSYITSSLRHHYVIITSSPRHRHVITTPS